MTEDAETATTHERRRELRKHLSGGLLAGLALSALASLAGTGALVLERRGLVTLRRVPCPIVRGWTDAKGTGIAIVNTDTTPGSFLLGYELDTAPVGSTQAIPLGDVGESGYISRVGLQMPQGDEERVWVPARSIVVRTPPKLRERGFWTVWLYDANGSPLRFWRGRGERAVPRGAYATLEWRRYPEWCAGVLPDTFYFVSSFEALGVRVVEGPGIAKDNTRTDVFHWDGQTPVIVEIDTTATPEIQELGLGAARIGDAGLIFHSLGDSSAWAYPPDMTLIDERDPPSRP